MSDHGHDKMNEFRRQRERLNEKLLGAGHKGIQRFFALDHQAYQDGGAVPARTKEMMGLSCSLVLRCDDCITYHVIRCVEEGIRRDEFMEIFNIALVVGGSIVIPHLRRAADRMDEALAARDD